MKFALIQAEKANFPIDFMCSQLGLSRSGFYAWRKRKPSARVKLRKRLQALHVHSRGTYGSPRMQEPLRALEPQARAFPIAGNILARGFDVALSNTAWATGITYIATHEGWLYLAAIIDLHSKRPLSALRRPVPLPTLVQCLVQWLLTMELKTRKPPNPGGLGGFNGGGQYGTRRPANEPAQTNPCQSKLVISQGWTPARRHRPHPAREIAA